MELGVGNETVEDYAFNAHLVVLRDQSAEHARDRVIVTERPVGPELHGPRADVEPPGHSFEGFALHQSCTCTCDMAFPLRGIGLDLGTAATLTCTVM